MKDTSSSSWTTQLWKVLFKYKLPTALQLVNDPLAKLKLKTTVKVAIKDYWNKSLKEETVLMKLLMFLHLEACVMGFSHLVWIGCPDPMQAVMTATKVLLLVASIGCTIKKTSHMSLIPPMWLQIKTLL